MLILQADTLRPVIAEQIQLAALGCHRSAAMEVQCDVVALLVEIDDVEILNRFLEGESQVQLKRNRPQAVIVQRHLFGKQDNLDDFILPCTAYACIDAIKSVCNNLEGKKAVVIGRSALVAKPLAHLLLKEDCTVTITHSKTVGLEKITKDADIIVSAVGKSKFLKKEMLKNNAIIIDVGISRSEDGKVSGDVDAEDIKDMDIFITPVPGGIGPMTVSYLIRNVCKLFIKQKGIEYEKQYF